jgi:hypothetical protein
MLCPYHPKLKYFSGVVWTATYMQILQVILHAVTNTQLMTLQYALRNNLSLFRTLYVANKVSFAFSEDEHCEPQAAILDRLPLQPMLFEFFYR